MPLAEPQPWDFGRAVRGHVWRAPRRAGTLLLQHGYAEYAERYVGHYHALVPHLVASGFDVHAFDMQGHGRTPGPRGAVDLDRAVEDHLAARAALAGVNVAVFLLGHSLGGLVTAASVAREPDAVAGVVLSAPALLIAAPPLVRLAARALAAAVPTMGLLAPQPASGISRDPVEVERFERNPMVYRGRMPAITGASTLRVAQDGWTRYRRWQAPTLVLHGTADTYTDPRGSSLFVGLIRSPDKQLHRFDEGRHELLNDLCRDEARNLIRSWLTTRL